MHFRFEHEFDIEPKDYWEMFFSEPYNQDLYKQLKMKTRELVEQKDEGKTLRRVVRLTPDEEIPAVFKSVIKDTSYVERNVFHRDRSVMDVVVEPAMMKNKFDLKATYSVVPSGPGRSRRIFEGDVKISVMIIGGQIEKYMVDKMRSSYDIATEVTRKWVAKRKASPSV